MDKNQFFYDVTSRICSSLKIDTAVYDTFLYIKQHLPVDQMYLGLHDTLGESYHVLAHADSTGGYTDRKFYETDRSTLPVLRAYSMKKEVMAIDDCESEPVLRAFYPREVYKGSSAMIVPLSLEKSFLGVLILFTKGHAVYTKEECQLMSLVTMPFAIAIANARKYIELTRLKEDLLQENLELKSQIENHSDLKLIGKNKGLKNVFETVNMVAPLNSPVIILGETGTGKEVLADVIHRLSGRSHGPYIKVNCGAIPPNLLDSQLFGFEKGAFTGADHMKKGMFERAHQGTIFLDEVGELTSEAQVRLLRVLQENEIERIGGSETIKVDIRVIAATHRDLVSMIKNGKFREDLYFRLNVFPIIMPPLRERREDIPDLLRYFIREKCHELNSLAVPEITEDALANLSAYHWPGNVRELQNLVERALILERNTEILTFKNLIPNMEKEENNEKILTMKEAEKLHIEKALKACSGRISGPHGAAKMLDMNPSTLRNRMYKLGLL